MVRLCQVYRTAQEQNGLNCLCCVLGVEARDSPYTVAAAIDTFFSSIRDWIETALAGGAGELADRNPDPRRPAGRDDPVDGDGQNGHVRRNVRRYSRRIRPVSGRYRNIRTRGTQSFARPYPIESMRRSPLIRRLQKRTFAVLRIPVWSPQWTPFSRIGRGRTTGSSG